MNAIVLVEAEVKTQLFAAPFFNELGTLWGQTSVTLCVEEAGARRVTHEIAQLRMKLRWRDVAPSA